MTTLKVYFNAHGPLPWCVHDGTTEHEVANVVMLNVVAGSRYDPAVPRLADHSGPPKAWLEAVGHLRIHEGTAYIMRPLYE